jgi:hypothetical protein
MKKIKLSELIKVDTNSCKSWTHPRKNRHKNIFITFDEIKDLLSRGIDKVSIKKLEMYLFEMRL